jgi:hypothetical protein
MQIVISRRQGSLKATYCAVESRRGRRERVFQLPNRGDRTFGQQLPKKPTFHLVGIVLTAEDLDVPGVLRVSGALAFN